MADLVLFRRLVDRVPWEAVPKCKGVQEGGTFPKREILKVRGQSVLMCQKMRWVGKKTSLTEQRALAGTQKGKESFDLWKKGHGTQVDYKDVVSLMQ